MARRHDSSDHPQPAAEVCWSAWKGEGVRLYVLGSSMGYCMRLSKRAPSRPRSDSTDCMVVFVQQMPHWGGEGCAFTIIYGRPLRSEVSLWDAKLTKASGAGSRCTDSNCGVTRVHTYERTRPPIR